jgi:hypothetical protein
MTTTMTAVPPKNNDRLHTIRIVIADDHPVVRIGVRNMLQSDAGLDVIGEASDGDEAITGTLELSSCLICRCPACLDWRRCGPS